MSHLFRLDRIDQVCVVVRDLETALARYWTNLGIGPWRVYTFSAPIVRDMTYRGRPADFAMRVAFAQVGSLMLELLQPLRGPSIYEEFLARCGEGLHHVGLYVPNLDQALQAAQAAGFAVLQSGRGYGLTGDGGFAYLDTEAQLGVIVELIEAPRQRRPPDFIYPPAVGSTEAG